ncbi:MAG: hypothetical protein AB7O67_03880 [Vicinamibacterales bacterium]
MNESKDTKGVFGAFGDGLGRVLSAPVLIFGLWGMTVLLALPLALTLRGMLATHLDASLAADAAARGVNFDWWNEFLAQAAGIGQTFVPAIIGFAAVLKNLGGLADAEGLPTVIASAVTAHLVVSTFLLGGMFDRLARGHRVGSAAFFSACGTYFFRFLRLGAIALAVYAALFVWLHPLLFDTLFGAWTRDVTAERTAFACRVALYAVFGLLVFAVNLAFDYAKVRAVVEDRRSMIGALGAGLRFARRNVGAVVSLYVINSLLFAAVLAGYAVLAPGADGGMRFWVGFLISQIYIVLRVIVRMQFAASQIALFQGRLAHAGYTAAPVPAWPDSPAAEAIRVE